MFTLPDRRQTNTIDAHTHTHTDHQCAREYPNMHILISINFPLNVSAQSAAAVHTCVHVKKCDHCERRHRIGGTSRCYYNNVDVSDNVWRTGQAHMNARLCRVYFWGKIGARFYSPRTQTTEVFCTPPFERVFAPHILACAYTP